MGDSMEGGFSLQRNLRVAFPCCASVAPPQGDDGSGGFCAAVRRSPRSRARAGFPEAQVRRAVSGTASA